MRRGAIITSLVTVGLLIVGSMPASALSLLGLGVGNPPASAQTQTANDQQTQSGISGSAANFLNDIVQNANENTCLAFMDHDYEVCTAYIFNASMAALVPYYDLAHSSNAQIAGLVSSRLDSRYSGQANALIRSRVSSWAAGMYDTDLPLIRILNVNTSLATNTATLRTQETWVVADGHGNVVYREDNAYHTVTMARVPSYLLHKWVVTDIQ